MTLHKKAEDVADEIWGFTYNRLKKSFIERVAAALVAFAEAQIPISDKDLKIQFDLGVGEGRNAAYEECAKIAEEHAEGTIKLCNDPAHDVRWCGACSNMRDEADILEQKIRALKEAK